MIFRSGLQFLAAAILLLTVLAVFVTMISSWAHFENFGRFIGIYGVQMLLQDGDQLLSFSRKMPSSVNRPLLVSAILVFLLIGFLSLSRNQVARSVQSLLVLPFMVTVVLSAAGSALWNHAEPVAESRDLRTDKVLQRVKDSEVVMLSSRAGPFTEIARAVSDSIFAVDERLNIDVNKLVKRQPDIELQRENLQTFNVVYMLVESLHPSVLAAYGGNPDIISTVNALSHKAYLFDKAFSQSSHSNYADVSALSGQYPLRSMDIHFYPENGTYPKSLPYDMLKPLGYRVGLFSSQNERWKQMDNYLSSPSVDIFPMLEATGTQCAVPTVV